MGPFYFHSLSFKCPFFASLLSFASSQHPNKDFDYLSAINITLFVSEVAADSMQQENTASSLSRFLTPSARRAFFHSRRQLTPVSPFYEQLLMLKIKAVSRDLFPILCRGSQKTAGPSSQPYNAPPNTTEPHTVHSTFIQNFHCLCILFSKSQILLVIRKTYKLKFFEWNVELRR